jgi:formylglycine-generating enzyme required for sulfatase activity
MKFGALTMKQFWTVLFLVLVCVIAIFCNCAKHENNDYQRLSEPGLTASDDDVTSDDDDDDDDDDSPPPSCPENMVFVPGGNTTVAYQGERWGGIAEMSYEAVTIDSFCIDKYEASQPDATADSQGSWVWGTEISIAKSKEGVLPWTLLSWEEAAQACIKAGKKLPTLAQWQTAFSGFEAYAWPWGYLWEGNSCYGQMAEGPYPTGGCCYEICSGGYCFETCDMVGNVSEWINGYWDIDCNGTDAFLIAGAASHNGWENINAQSPDPYNPGCWTFDMYAMKRWGLHYHGTHSASSDDGFRCAVARPQ